MKRALSILLIFMGISLVAFTQQDYVMFETVYIKPKPDKIEELKKNMAEHNKKYHSEAPYEVHIWNVHTGSHEGEWLWAMGPCTFTDLDNRPAGGGHDEDWQKHIDPYCEKIHCVEYWKLESDLSYMPEGDPGDKVVWSIFKIKPFEDYRFKALLAKIAEVYKEKKYPFGFAVYSNQFDSKKGRDFVIEARFEKWAFFDRERTFKKDYEEVHGEGSWWKAIEEFRDVVVCIEDELAEYNKDLSTGNPNN